MQEKSKKNKDSSPKIKNKLAHQALAQAFFRVANKTNDQKFRNLAKTMKQHLTKD